MFAQYLPYFVGIRYEMNGSDFVFLLLHDEVSISEEIGEESMTDHVYLHDL